MLFYNTIQIDYQEENKEHSGRENNLAQGHTMMGVKMAMSSQNHSIFPVMDLQMVFEEIN